MNKSAKRLLHENVERVHSLFICDRRRSLHDIARQTGISFGAVQSILTRDVQGLCKMGPRNIDQRAGLIFLSISCLSMKMTLRNLCIELWPKMRLWSITLILRPKSRVCNGSSLAHPLLRNLRVSSAGNVMASTFWDSPGLIMVDYLEEGHMINGTYYAELRQLRQEIVKKSWRKLTGGVLLLQDNAPAHPSQVVSTAGTNAASRSFLIPSILQI